ncbi:MAG: hypothetical protein E7481_08360 [Ruminococcaceae bacterium]|nr:hypothetical protein [Oscillospiraceae bacterium]
MKIVNDWHIHTECSCDDACLTFDNLILTAKNSGLTDFGVTDHLHSLVQEADIANSRKEFDRIIAENPHLKGHFHFGIEASVMSKWELDKINRKDYEGSAPIYGIGGGPKNAEVDFAFNDEFLEKYGVEYIVSGVHWTRYDDDEPLAVAKDYHRQYLFAASHPKTTILAHYLWWNPIRGMENPFLSDKYVTDSMRNELKAALLQYGKAFELNLDAVILSHSEAWLEKYLGFVSELQSSGVKLSVGSDCHDGSLNGTRYSKAAKLFETYNIDTSKFFTL